MKSKFTPFLVAIALAICALGLFYAAPDAVAAYITPDQASALPFLAGFGLETGSASMTDLKKLIEDQGRAWEEFKSTHAEQIKELKAGRSDPLLEEKLQKIGTRLDDLQAQKDELEKKFNRPLLQETDENRAETKALRSFNLEIKAAAIIQGRAQPSDVSIEQFRDYKRCFDEMMRKGDKHLSEVERKALQVGVDSDGGYLVPADTSGRIVTKLFDLSPIRQIANVQVIGSDRLEGIEDTGEADCGWVSEIGARSDSATPTVGKYEIIAQEMYAMPKATQRLLDDASVDVEVWLGGKVADKLARTEGAAFVNGNGVGKPRGFTAYTTAATADATRAWGTLEHVNTGANGDFHTTQADPLFDLISAFKQGYLNGARWVTRRSVIAKIRKFKTSTTSEYIWQPGLQAGQPAQLLGFPVTMAEDMPTLATGSLSMALGNFQLGYQIVDRLGIRVLRDPFTAKPYVVFYTTKRTGGAVVNFEAVKFIRFAA